VKNIEAKWGRGKGQMFTLKSGRGGGIFFLNETSACAMKVKRANRLISIIDEIHG
jgi:phosphoribosyl 1,2-cyclic phosphodiesterase